MNAISFRRVGIALFLLSVANIPAAAAPTPAPFDLDLAKLPYKAHWGSYIVSVPSENIVRISDSSGRALKEIRPPGAIETVDYPDMSGHGDCEEVRIVATPGNNTLADWRTYCFSRKGGLHPVLEMRGMFLDSVRALDHSARPELLVDDAGALEWIGSVSHGDCPQVRLVLQWNGRSYVIANRKFPKIIRGKADWYRQESLRAWKSKDGDGALGAAFGYWANLAMIDQEASARQWALSKLPDGLRERFFETLPEIRERLAKIPSRITSGR